MIADLIGLKHKFGAQFSPNCTEIDCFALACEARRRLCLHDYEPEFQWVYETCSGNDLPVKQIIRILLSIARESTAMADGNIALVSMEENNIGLATVVSEGFLSIGSKGRSFWTPRLKPIKMYRMNCDVQ